MTLRIPAKVLLHVWSYDFYDMTLSTGKQRCHMINVNVNIFSGDTECTKLHCIKRIHILFEYLLYYF